MTYALSLRNPERTRPVEVVVDVYTAAARGKRRVRSCAVSATCRWTSWRTPSRRSAPGTGCGARRPSRSVWIDPWPGTARPLPGSARPSGSRAFLPVDGLAERLALRLERADPLHELLERLRHRVRQVGLVEIHTVDPLPVLVCYSARHADHNGVRRHLADDHRAGADAAVVADREAADDLGARAHRHVVAERRVALLLLEARPRQTLALGERHVLADPRGLADHHPHAVVDEEPAPEPCGRMDLDAGQETREVRHPARARCPPRAPEPVRDAAES